MHIPESLQDLASSEAVQLLRRPKTITRVFEGVRPSRGPTMPLGDRSQELSTPRQCGRWEGGRQGRGQTGRQGNREQMLTPPFPEHPTMGPCY